MRLWRAGGEAYVATSDFHPHDMRRLSGPDRRKRHGRADHSPTGNPTLIEHHPDPIAMALLQRSVGNRAVTGLISEVVQRDTPKLPASAPVTDEGGPATVTDLEQDLHDVLAEWAAGADQAVVLFGATALSERIDAIESGSWETFLSGLVGNTVWAATTFIPPGDLAFGLSVAGIGLAAAPTVPSKSKSAIPEVTKMMQDYINGVTMAMTPKLREPAAARLADHPGETRYRALASIVRNSFQPGTYTIDTGYATAPTLNRTAIRDRMLDVANERLQIAIDVGSAHTLPHDKEHWSDRTRVTEVAYVRGSFGRPRLAILKSNWQGPDTHDGTVPDGSSHELIRWVTDEGKRAAIDQWMTQRQNQPPQTYPPQAIDGLVG